MLSNGLHVQPKTKTNKKKTTTNEAAQKDCAKTPLLFKCPTGYCTLDHDSSCSVTQEVVVGFGDAALECKTWTGQVSGSPLKI